MPAPMRAALISATQSDTKRIDEVLSVEDNVVRPPRPLRGQLLVRVLACSLSPDDVRALSADLDYWHRQKTPFVPGGDVCGVVVTVDPAAPSAFTVGETVIAMHVPTMPTGGLAEYALVRTDYTAHAPAGVSALHAAALPSSALSALMLARYIADGSRVLILGGAGGVGTHLVQLARQAGASFVAVTSTQHTLLSGLGADYVVDYRKENWWEVPDFVEQPFDLLIDLVGGPDGWPRAKRSGAVKSKWRGGRFATSLPDAHRAVVHTAAEAFWLHVSVIRRALYATVWWNVPAFSFPTLLAPAQGNLEHVSRLVTSGRLTPVLEGASPLPFSKDGIARAYKLQASGRAHGKVVIQIAPEARDVIVATSPSAVHL